MSRLCRVPALAAVCFSIYAQQYAFVTNSPTGAISIIDTKFNALVATPGGFSSPKGIAVTRDGTRVYVANHGGSSVIALDAISFQQADSVTLASKPNAVAVNPEGTRVYAASETGVIYVIQPFAQNTIQTITPAGSHVFEHIIVNKAGTRAYVASQAGNGSVVVINTTTNTVVTTIAFPSAGAPDYIALNADESILYAATQAGLVQVDTATNTFTRRDMSSIAFRGVALKPGTSTPIYLTSEVNGTVTLWNANNTQGPTISIGTPVRGIAMRDATTAYLTAPVANKVIPLDLTTNIPGQQMGPAGQGTPAQIAIAPLRQPAGCIPSFNSLTESAPASGGPNVLSFTLNTVCDWTAISNVPWITFPSGSAGTGPDIVAYDVAPNSSAAARTGAIFVNGRRFLITQAGINCTYSITPGTKQAPAATDTGIIVVGAPPGCDWTATSDVPWLNVGPEPEGSGSGYLFFDIAANPTAARRTGTIRVAGQPFTVLQEASNTSSYGCQTAGSSLSIIRQEGLAEGMEDLRMTCSGTIPPGGASGDIQVTLTAMITSRVIGPSPEDVDVWLILNDATNPVVGTTAFRGKLTGPSSVRFANVPLTNVVNGMARFSIVNLRVNGASVPPFSSSGGLIAAVVQIKSTKFITLSGDLVPFGFTQPGMTTQMGEPFPLASGHVVLPVSFNEFTNTDFRPKTKPQPQQTSGRFDSESLFAHPSLGAQAGAADSGTRLRLRIPVAAGVKVWAPVSLIGPGTASLVSADANGLGGSLVSGSAMFGGVYQELTPTNGFATAVWEVMAANALSRETLTANLVFQGADLVATGRTLLSSFAPTSTKGVPDQTSPVPRFLDPLATPRIVNLRVVPSIQFPGTLSSSKASVREIVGSNFRFDYNVVNDGSDQATNVIVRGNLPPGFNYTSCSRSDAGPCTVTGSEARAEIATLDGGEGVSLSVQATQAVDVPGGTVLENSVSASSDQFDADLESNQASTPFVVDTCPVTLSSSSASIGGGGGTGSFSFGSCPSWVVQVDVPWISFTTPTTGSGAGTVNFTVARNNLTSPRTGTIYAAGRPFTVNQAAGDGCVYQLAAPSTSVTAAGVKTTVRLTVTGSGCSWTASSPVSWVQVFPLNGTATTNVEYNVFPNFSTRVRSATLSIGGEPFSIVQGANALDANGRFVQLAYFNFVGRLPSSQEIAQQSAVLSAGTPRGNFIQSFYNTEEFNLGGRFIAGLYVGILNRDAEYGGWLFQRSALATGVVDQTKLVSNFLGSPEYQLKFGNPTAQNFVTLLYRNVLLREPGPTDVNFHITTSLTPDTPANRVELARRFLNTAEFRVGTGPRLTAFLLYSTLLQRGALAADRDALAQEVFAGTPLLTLINRFINLPEFTELLN